MSDSQMLDIADPKRRRAPEERPGQILDAAFYEFGQRGLAGARLDDIARRANVAKGTIYLYFPNKEALFQEMIRATIVTALELAEQRLDVGDEVSGPRQVAQFMDHWWTFLRSERFQVVHRLVMAELSHFPDLVEFYAEEVVARGRRVIASIIKRGVLRGEFREIDPDIAARMLQALTIKHTTWCASKMFFPSLAAQTDDEVRDQIVDFFLHALRPLAAAHT